MNNKEVDNSWGTCQCFNCKITGGPHIYPVNKLLNNKNIDEQSVLSDLTDNNTTLLGDNVTQLSPEIENSSILLNQIEELKIKVAVELNKLTLDGLKEKCKENGISGVSKTTKPKLIQTLENEFIKLISCLQEKKLNDIKIIYKQCNIKGNSSSKKDVLLYNILLNCCSNFKFKFDMIALKMIHHELKLKQDEEIALKIKQDEENSIKNKLKEDKKKRQVIPKNVRMIVWNHYIGEDIIKHKCLCCKKVTISNTNFEVGHVISEKHNGTHEINNLRPICFACNHSMGCENMIDFVVKFGLFIG